MLIRFIYLSLATLSLSPAFDARASTDSQCEQLLTAQAHKIIASNKFPTERGLNLYRIYFGDSFLELLSGLKANQHWLDVGAGSAIATRVYQGLVEDSSPDPNQFYNWHSITKQTEELTERLNKIPLKQRARTTAISYLAPDNIPRLANKGRFRFITGELFTSISPKVSGEAIGKVDLITDLFGAFVYSPDPDAVLAKYLRVLNKNGRILIVAGRGLFSYFEHSFVNTKRGRVTLLDWIMNIPGLEVRANDNGETLVVSIGIAEGFEGEITLPVLKLIDVGAGLSSAYEMKVFDELHAETPYRVVIPAPRVHKKD